LCGGFTTRPVVPSVSLVFGGLEEEVVKSIESPFHEW
jgi:hypothetical protein